MHGNQPSVTTRVFFSQGEERDRFHNVFAGIALIDRTHQWNVGDSLSDTRKVWRNFGQKVDHSSTAKIMRGLDVG